LKQDLAKFQAELKAIKKLKTDMAEYRAKQLQTLSFLYHNNLQLRGTP
jgi:hypothetical protein